MKPNIPNQKKAYDALNSRLIKYMAQVQSIYDRIATQTAIAVEGVGYDGSVEFLFDNYPELTNTINNIMSGYAAQMNNLIYSGTSSEWKESNIIQDLLARKVLRAYDFEKGGDKYNRYFQPNSEALKTFQRRADNGMNLSQKLWVQSEGLKTELEQTISTAIDKGQSAVVLSKRISKYLSDFPSMKADYTEKYGKAVSCRDCQYASIRLARTEINMAYREAEQLRWKQFDFILGYEVKLSKRHPAPDICNDLQGKYPKDFKFVGWHPNCMCYVIPIVMSDKEYYGLDKNKTNISYDGLQRVEDYTVTKSDKLRKGNVTQYWLKYNKGYWEKFLLPYSLTEDDISFLISQGFKSFDYVSYNKSAMRGVNLPFLDKNIERACDKIRLGITKKQVVFWGDYMTSVKYDGVNQRGERFCTEITFEEKEGKRYAILDRVTLPATDQRKGFAKELLRNIYMQCRNIGADYINCYADLEIGGYAWARYGFKAFVPQVYLTIAENKSAIQIFKDWKKSHQNEKYFPMNLIAKQEYGAELLIGKEWEATLDFNDKESLNRFKSYIKIQ